MLRMYNMLCTIITNHKKMHRHKLHTIKNYTKHPKRSDSGSPETEVTISEGLQTIHA